MMNIVWKWLGRIGKIVGATILRAMFICTLSMAVLAFMPGSIGKWAFNFWLSVDQFGNTITFGDPDETISSRMGKWITEDDVGEGRVMWGNALCYFLDMVDEDHCQNSIDPEEGKDAVMQ